MIISFLALSALTVLSACTPKENTRNNTDMTKGSFEYEKQVLLNMIDALSRYRAGIMKAEGPDDVAKANYELAERLDTLNPQIVEITGKHPDWNENPPPEVKKIVEEYKRWHQEYEMASIIAEGYIDEYPDHEGLKDSWASLTHVLDRD